MNKIATIETRCGTRIDITNGESLRVVDIYKNIGYGYPKNYAHVITLYLSEQESVTLGAHLLGIEGAETITTVEPSSPIDG